MIALVLLALGLGAALTVYELSPTTRSRVDSYVAAIRSAAAAHQAADGHLGNAHAATAAAARLAQRADATRRVPPAPRRPQPPQPQPQPAPQWQPPWQPQQPPQQQPQPQPVVQPPLPEQVLSPAPETMPSPAQDAAAAQDQQAQAAADVAVDHAAAAIESNQDAAQNTADAAAAAQTEAERQAAAQSAVRVLEREQKIAAALASLGVGQCGVRSFPRVNERVKNALITRLRGAGMVVTGDNPWNIDTHEYGVKLRAVWNPTASVLKLIVTSGKGGYLGLVTCEEIWKKIDPILKEVTT